MLSESSDIVFEFLTKIVNFSKLQKQLYQRVPLQTIVILKPNGRRETAKVKASSLLTPLFAEVVSEIPIRLKQRKISKAPNPPPFRGIFLKQIIEIGVFTMKQKFTNLYDAMCNSNTLMYNQR